MDNKEKHIDWMDVYQLGQDTFQSGFLDLINTIRLIHSNDDWFERNYTRTMKLNKTLIEYDIKVDDAVYIAFHLLLFILISNYTVKSTRKFVLKDKSN